MEPLDLCTFQNKFKEISTKQKYCPDLRKKSKARAVFL